MKGWGKTLNYNIQSCALCNCNTAASDAGFDEADNDDLEGFWVRGERKGLSGFGAPAIKDSVPA
jgi:hypothetical protein